MPKVLRECHSSSVLQDWGWAQVGVYKGTKVTMQETHGWKKENKDHSSMRELRHTDRPLWMLTMKCPALALLKCFHPV